MKSIRLNASVIAAAVVLAIPSVASAGFWRAVECSAEVGTDWENAAEWGAAVAGARATGLISDQSSCDNYVSVAALTGVLGDPDIGHCECEFLFNPSEHQASWYGWIGNQGTTSRRVAAAYSSASGTIDSYVRGDDGFIYQRWWNQSGWGPTADGWLMHPQMTTYYDPEVVYWNGTPFLYLVDAAGTGHEWHFDGYAWLPSKYFAPKGLESGITTYLDPFTNVLNVFALCQGSHLCGAHWQNGVWSAWTVIDWSTVLTGPPTAAGYPSVVGFPSVIAIAARGPNGSVVMKQWISGGYGWTGWSDLGGLIQPGDAVAIDSPVTGSFDLFVRGMDNALYAKLWDGSYGVGVVPHWVPSQSGWQGLDSFQMGQSPRSIGNLSSRHVFSTRTDHHAMYKAYY